MSTNEPSFLKKGFFWPSKNIAFAIPIMLIIGFLAGIWVDTSILKQWVLPITMLMIYPTMIGFKAKEVFNMSQGKLFLTVMGLNFLVIPGVAYILGTGFLLKDPQLFAGLAITALLPTSNMTIAFTMLAKGNVPAAIQMTTSGLLLGSVLAPGYLYLMVGKYVPVDIFLTLKTIALVIIIPLIFGMLTYKFLMKRYSQEHFQKKIKPFLPAASTWGMLLIIFISMSMNAKRIAQHLDIFAMALGVQMVFYAINYLLAILVGRRFFSEKDALTLVFSTVLRNLSISIGLAATAFGSNAALMVSLAFLIQGQVAAWFIKLNEKYGFLKRGTPIKVVKE
ncbi:bile acid:sodium symporter [Desulfitobacterium sp. THU1]|uniref:arsenic resistance protein n=1 Tax=Desulfitobacterium sp. THU1 TaxID=3138072 RepID=UPI0031204839